MRTGVLLCTVVACGGSDKTIQNATPAPPTASKPTPCAPQAELDAMMVKPWGPDAKVEICVPLVLDGKAMWWLEGYSDAPPDTMHQRPVGNALVDDRRGLVWVRSGREDPHALQFEYGYPPPAIAADVNGDGNDEVLYARTGGEGGISMTWLEVIYFEPEPVFRSIDLESNEATAERCEATWALVPGSGRSKRIEVVRSTGCSRPARAVYERRGDKFVEL